MEIKKKIKKIKLIISSLLKQPEIAFTNSKILQISNFLFENIEDLIKQIKSIYQLTNFQIIQELKNIEKSILDFNISNNKEKKNKMQEIENSLKNIESLL